jgi:hypothetical protein
VCTKRAIPSRIVHGVVLPGARSPASASAPLRPPVWHWQAAFGGCPPLVRLDDVRRAAIDHPPPRALGVRNVRRSRAVRDRPVVNYLTSIDRPSFLLFFLLFFSSRASSQGKVILAILNKKSLLTRRGRSRKSIHSLRACQPRPC